MKRPIEEIKQLPGKDILYYDSRTGNHMVVESVADITSKCIGLEEDASALLLYSSDSDGRCVKVVYALCGQTDGISVLLSVDKLEQYEESIRQFARFFGMSSEELTSLIIDNAE